MTLDELVNETLAYGYDPSLDREYAPSPDGNGEDFGVLRQDAAEHCGLSALPIRIAHGEHRGATNGYGIRHILLGHGEELAKQNWNSVQDFVLCVIDDFDVIYLDPNPNRWHLVCRADSPQKMHSVLVIEATGGHYRVITGWLREGYRKFKNKPAWERRGRSSGPGESSLR